MKLSGLRQTSDNDSQDAVVLLLQVPRTNDNKALSAEQMLASLHGLLTMPARDIFSRTVREHISFEIAVIDKRIGFYVWAPRYLVSFIEEQIYAQYPTVQITEVEDYSTRDNDKYGNVLTTELRLVNNDVLPIKTFQSFEVDPLAGITATLAKFEEGEEAWVQLLIRPAAENWHRKSERYLASLRAGGAKTSGLLKALWTPPETTTTQPKLTEYESLRASGAETKSQKLAFECVVRVVYRSNEPEVQAKLRLQSIIASYKQFNTTYLNGFETSRIQVVPSLSAAYARRAFDKRWFILNIEEVATLYHLPHTNVETPFILWASAQTAEPPASLPIITSEYRPDVSPVAATNFRGHSTMFGLPRADRTRHLYIIGQTGVGKSGLLELLTISDIYSEFGFAVIDPHGDYAQGVLKRVPLERIEDVVYFNPADVDFPVAFNPMEVNDPKLKTHTASELIGVLKRMFESWGPRLEYILRYTLLALLDYPDATMLDITRMLTDKKFRNQVLKVVQDPVVRNFWQIEFASWNDKFAAEAVAPVLNKVGAFTANPLVRNIIGQPKSSFNIRKIMDEHKILVVNLSRGLVGEDNAALLGSLLVTKVQLAAMSRADIPASERTPFYLYVDEFQNFATDSFATILSEARKYGLNLTVANQYIAQMLPQVRDAVFGNVGSIVAFRMSADDGRAMQRYFEPKFTEYDLVHMHNRHFIISMTIEGEKVPAFSSVTLNLPPLTQDYTAAIIANSREHYAYSREIVEKFVQEQYLDAAAEPKPAKPSPAPPKVTTPAKPQPLPVTVPQPTAPAAAPEASEPRPKVPLVEAIKPSAIAHVILGARDGGGGQRNGQVDQPKPAPEKSQSPTHPTVAEVPQSEAAAKPKRKRTRKRKRKPDAEAAAPAAPRPSSAPAHAPISRSAPSPQPASPQSPVSRQPQEITGEGEIRLK